MLDDHPFALPELVHEREARRALHFFAVLQGRAGVEPGVDGDIPEHLHAVIAHRDGGVAGVPDALEVILHQLGLVAQDRRGRAEEHGILRI